MTLHALVIKLQAPLSREWRRIVKSLYAKSIWIIGFSGAEEGRVLIMVISYTNSLYMPILQNKDSDSHIGSAFFPNPDC